MVSILCFKLKCTQLILFINKLTNAHVSCLYTSDSLFMSDLQDLKSFTSDRDLTRTKSLLKPTPVYPEDVSDYTTTDQGSYISHSETSGQSQGWTENEETPSIGESPETKGFKFNPSNRDPRWLNRVKLDHSLPGN